MNSDMETEQAGGKNVLTFPDRKSVRDQAAEWVARLEVSEPDEGDLAEFRAWIKKSNLHCEEFERLNVLWGDLNLLTQITLPTEQVRHNNKYKAKQPFNKPFISGRYALAAIAVLAGLLLLIFPLKWNDQQSQQLYSTAIGEQRTVELPDKSSLVLNTNSRIAIDFSEKRRIIYLEKGEVHFEVYKNPNRPFEVYAGAAMIRAVGTAFNVRLREREVEVIVDEGVVEIAAEQGNKRNKKEAAVDSLQEPVRLTAGNQATYEKENPKAVTVQRDVEVDRKLAWREGLLEFRREPLERVIGEVSRYTSVKLIITDDALRQQKVGGRFKIGDTQSLLEVLESGFSVEIERGEDNAIYLSYAKN